MSTRRKAGSRKKSSPTAAKKTDSKQFSLISNQTLLAMYDAMLACRKVEMRALRNSRRVRKQIPAGAAALTPVRGQEAVIVGTTIDLRADDTITAPSGNVVFRQEKRPASRTARAEQAVSAAQRNIIALAASTGSQLTVGAGVALANKEQKKERVVVSFGDADATTLGAWSEALHLAGVHRLPIILVLRPGNQDTETERAVAAVCEYARVADVITIPVDYTDVVAMYRVGFESIARARKCTGATLIVSTRYEVEGESVGKSDSDLDPIARMKLYLASKGLSPTRRK